jgi:hypothetical protein
MAANWRAVAHVQPDAGCGAPRMRGQAHSLITRPHRVIKSPAAPRRGCAGKSRQVGDSFGDGAITGCSVPRLAQRCPSARRISPAAARRGRAGSANKRTLIRVLLFARRLWRAAASPMESAGDETRGLHI